MPTGLKQTQVPALIAILSGGQTGVDRAALDAALAHGVPHGGWCPRGRRAEDGRIPERYRLRETSSADYAERTRRNASTSDATLLLARGPLLGGTALTLEILQELERPHLLADPDRLDGARAVADWVAARAFQTLNVAGPRASTDPGVYASARAFMDALLLRLRPR